jgi:hypothetical protein
VSSGQSWTESVEVRQPPRVSDELAVEDDLQTSETWAAGTDSVTDRPERVRTMT